jgi:uncharacterized protein
VLDKPRYARQIGDIHRSPTEWSYNDHRTGYGYGPACNHLSPARGLGGHAGRDARRTRQAGKSTLVQALAAGAHPARCDLTLDDLRTLEAAHRDPVGLIENAEGPLIIDEIQRAPELLLPVKAAIDTHRRPGRFILTGSAQVMLLPKVSESLTGRVEVHTLWPFSQAEIEDVPGRIVELLFDQRARPPVAPACSRADMIDRIARGGYPEALRRGDDRREEWLSSYLTTSVQRELRDLANIERLAEVPTVLASIAARVRAPLNKAYVSSSVGVPRTTLDRYLTLLEQYS